MMGELGDWGYWLLVLIAICLGAWWGHTMKEFKLYSTAWDKGYKRGYDEGFQKGYKCVKEKRRIDVRV